MPLPTGTEKMHLWKYAFTDDMAIWDSKLNYYYLDYLGQILTFEKGRAGMIADRLNKGGIK